MMIGAVVKAGRGLTCCNRRDSQARTRQKSINNRWEACSRPGPGCPMLTGTPSMSLLADHPVVQFNYFTGRTRKL